MGDENKQDKRGQPVTHEHEDRLQVQEDCHQYDSCGWGAIQPVCCQRFRTPVCVLFWLCCSAAIQGAIVNGFVNTVITSLEKRFEISSTESGVIASCYDIGFILTAIPVSYFGGLGKKPRYLSIGFYAIALGSFIFAIPHFTTGLYLPSSGQDNTCLPGSNRTSLCGTNAPESLSQYKYVFYLSQLVIGCGTAPLYTLGVTYLEENLPLHSTSFYVGIFYSFSIIGSGSGYLAGGQFLKTYTDIGSVDLSQLKIDRYNPRWVGAWWMGFFVTGILAFIIATVMLGFPRSLPGSSKYLADKGKEVYVRKSRTDAVENGHRDDKEVYVIKTRTDVMENGHADDKEVYVMKTQTDVTENGQADGSRSKKRGVKHLLLSTKLILLNPTFIFLTLASTLEGIIVGGIATFGPKYIEYQFGLTASSAGQYLGLIALPAGGLGTFLSGYLVKRFRLKIRGIIRLCIVSSHIAIATMFVFLVKCENSPFAGVNIHYGDTPQSGDLGHVYGNLSDGCNAGCDCTEENYQPVCGQDNTMYFSPCYAGCDAVSTESSQKYSNCSCVNFTETSDTPYSASIGRCDVSCVWFPVFLPVFGVAIFFTFMSSIPGLSATLRCIPEEQSSLALAIQWIIVRCLGAVPAPILFGKIIDLTCELWQTRCDEIGSCFFYDNPRMSYYLLALSMAVKVLAVVFFFLALIFYRSAPQDEAAKMADKSSSVSQSTLDTVVLESTDI